MFLIWLAYNLSPYGIGRVGKCAANAWVGAEREKILVQNASQIVGNGTSQAHLGKIRCMEIRVMHEKCFTVSYSEKKLKKK